LQSLCSGDVHPEKHGEWAREIVREHSFTSLDYIRLTPATTYASTPEQAAFAYKYLTRDGVTNTRYATRFDWRVALRHGYDFISEAHSRRNRDFARKALEDDPYSPDLIKTLQSGVGQFSTPENTSLRFTYIERPTQKEALEYARRLLVISPYNPEYYSDYAYLISKEAAGFLKGEPFWINAIVYDNHKPERIKAYMARKFQQISDLQQMATGENGEGVQNLAESVDKDEAIICPMLRAYRLYDSICETYTHESCKLEISMRVRLTIALADATKRNVCITERTTPELELYYTPIPVDLPAPQ
jgi:hypothetical protein